MTLKSQREVHNKVPLLDFLRGGRSFVISRQQLLGLLITSLWGQKSLRDSSKWSVGFTHSLGGASELTPLFLSDLSVLPAWPSLQGVFQDTGPHFPGGMLLRSLKILHHSGNPPPQCILLSHFSRVRLCATPQTAAHQAPLSLGFSRHEHWSRLPFQLTFIYTFLSYEIGTLRLSHEKCTNSRFPNSTSA